MPSFTVWQVKPSAIQRVPQAINIVDPSGLSESALNSDVRNLKLRKAISVQQYDHGF